jgi:ribose transport system substrate-binding protein
MKSTLKIIGLVATLAIAATAFAVPVAAQDEEMGQMACLLAPASTTPYSARINAKIEEYGAEQGIQFTVLSAEQDPAVQVDQMRDCIAQGVDGIILISTDLEAICPVLQEAGDAGIPVLTSNAGVSCTDLVEGFTGPNYTLQANIMGQYTCDTLLPDGGNVAIVSGALGYSATVERTDGFVNTIAENCPDVTIIDTQPTDWSRQSALQIARDYVTKYGAEGIDMIYAQDDTLAAGVAEGLEQSGVAPGDILLVGIGGNVDGFDLMENGWMQATIYQSPFFDGELAVDTMLRIFAGEDVEDFIPIESPVITPDNMSEFEPAY